MTDLQPPLGRRPLGASLAPWLLGVGLLATGGVVGVLLRRPAFGLPSWWSVLPVVAPYLVLGVAAMVAGRSTPVLAGSVACLGLGCAAALLAAGLLGFDEAWQRSISGFRGSGSGQMAKAWLAVALLQGGLALLADRLLARSVKAGERILWYLGSAFILFGVVTAALGGIVGRQRPSRFAPPEAVAINQAVRNRERAAASAMLWIHGAAQRYRLRHHDAGYPASLADIARDEARGEESSPPAFKAVLATGAWSGYRIQYRALPSGDGAVEAYELTALPPPPANPPKSPQIVRFLQGARSYFSDQTGVLHGAQGTADAGSPVETLLATYSIGLDLGEARRELDNDWARQGEFPEAMESHVRNAAAAGYLLTYRPERGAAGVRDRFHLEARPLRYGETGLRSYLLDESGEVHATPEPRPARLDDPLADDCELLGWVKTCSAGTELAAGERWPRRPGLHGLPQASSTPAAPPRAGETVAGVTADGTVVVTSSSPDTLSAMDPRGQVLWQFRQPSRSVIVGRDTVYVATAEAVWAISSRGTARWRVRPPGGATRMAAAPDGTLILLTATTLHAVDREGGERWRHHLPGIVFNGDRAEVRVAGEEVDLSVRGTTTRYALSDGRPLAP